MDHLRRGDARLAAALEGAEVLVHPFVIGELACGNLSRRDEVLALLGELPAAPVAEADEVLAFVSHRRLHGRGIGYVDVHLLVSTVLAGGARLWTRDRRLHAVATQLGCAA